MYLHISVKSNDSLRFNKTLKLSKQIFYLKSFVQFV